MERADFDKILKIVTSWSCEDQHDFANRVGSPRHSDALSSNRGGCSGTESRLELVNHTRGATAGKEETMFRSDENKTHAERLDDAQKHVRDAEWELREAVRKLMIVENEASAESMAQTMTTVGSE